jgi:hypothetical protein
MITSIPKVPSFCTQETRTIQTIHQLEERLSALEIALSVGSAKPINNSHTKALDDSPANEFVELWLSGACDEEARAILADILSREELSGRVVHGQGDDPQFGVGLLSTDTYKRLSWIFGPDALATFLGKTPREICLLLGFGEDWLNDKTPKGKKFKLAIFPSSSVDSKCATWDGLEYILKENYPEVWSKIADHISQIRRMGFAAIEAEAGYDMSKAHLVGRR